MQRFFATSFLFISLASLTVLWGCAGAVMSDPPKSALHVTDPGGISPVATPTPTPAASPTPTQPPIPVATPTPSPVATPDNSLPPGATVVSNIQTLAGWETCATAACAGGLGDALSTMLQNQASPSLSGNSAEFTLAGSTNYSNALWWKQLIPDAAHTHFRYDLWVYVSNPEFPQALEFDVNQTVNQTRYIFGTECNFQGSKKWDVWDGATARWIPSSVDCTPFPTNSWTHLVWNFERTNGQVRYVDVTVNGNTQSVNMYLTPLANVNASEINVAVQLDGNYEQDPFSIWVDKVTLTHW